MNDQQLLVDALRKASLIVAGYLESRDGDPKRTLDALIPVLDNRTLSAALKRLEGKATA